MADSKIPKVNNLLDPTNNIGNHRLGLSSESETKAEKHASGHIIHFVHVPTNKTCHFKAFLTDWNDNFKQDWKDYTTVGRMDPIRIYTRTSRQINFSLSIPSYDLEEAAYNLMQIENLIQMSYPTFQTTQLVNNGTNTDNGASTGNANDSKRQSDIGKITGEQNGNKTFSLAPSISTMISPPYFRLKFANWMTDPSTDKDMLAVDSNDSGLYGTIDNVKYQPDLSTDGGGFFSAQDMYDLDGTTRSENVLLPKLLKLDIMFTVLHTNLLGFDSETRKSRTESFPYNASKIYNKIINKKIKVK